MIFLIPRKHFNRCLCRHATRRLVGPSFQRFVLLPDTLPGIVQVASASADATAIANWIAGQFNDKYCQPSEDRDCLCLYLSLLRRVSQHPVPVRPMSATGNQLLSILWTRLPSEPVSGPLDKAMQMSSFPDDRDRRYNLPPGSRRHGMGQSHSHSVVPVSTAWTPSCIIVPFTLSPQHLLASRVPFIAFSSNHNKVSPVNV